MKKAITVMLSLVFALAMILPMSLPVSAATTMNAVYDSRSSVTPGTDFGKVYTTPPPVSPPPTDAEIATDVSAPDDGQYIQLGPASYIILKFPDNWYASRNSNPSPDLRIDVSGLTAPTSAEIFISNDGTSWYSLGIYDDSANIDIDLDSISFSPPVKYVKVYEDSSYITPANPRGFDVDAVVALNALIMWKVAVGSSITSDIAGVPGSPFSGLTINWSISTGRSGTGQTSYNNFCPDSKSITLTAPWLYNNGTDFYVFRSWALGNMDTPLPLPGQTLNQPTLTITPDQDKQAKAVYQRIDFGPISPQTPVVSPVRASHTLSVDLTALPGPEPPSPPFTGIPISFLITGPNSSSSGIASTDSIGRAAFTYTGNHVGVDHIFAYIDGNQNGSWDSGEPRYY